MSLEPGQEIGQEVHDGDQILYVVDGKGLAVLDGAEDELDKGSIVFVPAGTTHNVINTDDERSCSPFTRRHSIEWAPCTERSETLKPGSQRKRSRSDPAEVFPSGGGGVGGCAPSRDAQPPLLLQLIV